MSNAAVFLNSPDVNVAAAGALSGDGSIGDPLQVEVDNDTITINGSNQLEAAISLLVHQASVPLTNGQIKTLPTLPVTVVAHPGTALIITPLWGWLIPTLIDPYDGASIDNNISANFVYGTNTAFSPSGFADTTAMVDAFQSGDPVRVNIPGGGVIVGNEIHGFEVYDTDGEDKALSIRIGNGATGNLTGGNAGNTAIVSVAYLLFNTTTGLFV